MHGVVLVHVHVLFDNTVGVGSALVHNVFQMVFFFVSDPVVTNLCGLSLKHLGVVAGRYIYMGDLRQLPHPPSSRTSVDINWPHCPTPIRVNVLANYLRSHPDREFVRFILEGLSAGFHAGYSCLPGGTIY